MGSQPLSKPLNPVTSPEYINGFFSIITMLMQVEQTDIATMVL
jgi:hypothetical protein